MGKKRESKTKIKKKTWFKILAPKIFNGQVIGKTLLESAELMMGKPTTVSLMNMTGDMKKQGTVVKFKVVSVKPEGGLTEIVGYEILPATVKRFVKRQGKALSDSFECTTKDGVKIRIKPFVFTRNKAKGSAATQLRKTIKAVIMKKVKETRYDVLTSEIIFFKMQRKFKEDLNKIFPIRIADIRAFKKISGEAKPVEEEKPKEEAPKAAEAKKEEVKEASETKVSDTHKEEAKPEEKKVEEPKVAEEAA